MAEAEQSAPMSIEQRLSALNPSEPETAPEPKAVEPKAVETRQAQRGEDSKFKPKEVQVEAQEQAEQETGQEAEQEAEEAREITSLPELLDYLKNDHEIDIDPSDLYALGVPVDNEGKSDRVSLSELKDAYQANRKATKVQQELQAQREQFEQQRKDLEQQANLRLQEAASLVDFAEKQLTEEMQAVNWNELYQEDPARYAAEKSRMQDKQRAIEQAKQKVIEHHQQNMQQAQAKQSQEMETLIAREREALFSAIPEWQDETKAKAEMPQLREYLTSQGYKPDELDHVADHRAVVMARKAWLYDNTIKATDVARKKVVRIGKKPLQPGTRLSKEQQRQSRVEPLRERLRKSGKVDDAIALLSERSR